jgi:hypothetical protein
MTSSVTTIIAIACGVLNFALISAATVLSLWSTRCVPNHLRQKHDRATLIRMLQSERLEDLPQEEATVAEEFRRRKRLARIPVVVLFVLMSASVVFFLALQ